MPNFGTRKGQDMGEIEGSREIMEVSLKMIDLLEKMFGFTFGAAAKGIGVVGSGFGKMVRILYHLYKNDRMLGGGKRTFQQIVRNKGSLDMAISTVYFENWKSPEGKKFQEYLKNRGIQFVLLDDITKGDNRVQFMFHASDADRVNSLMAEYAKLNEGFKAEDAVPLSDAYDSLDPNMKAEVNSEFERELSVLNLQAMGISNDSVWNHMDKVHDQKKTVFNRTTWETPKATEEVIIPSEYTRKDSGKEMVFIRARNKEYVIPSSITEDVNVADDSGSVDKKLKVKIDVEGKYLSFCNGRPEYAIGKELLRELKKIRNDLTPYARNENLMRENGLEMKSEKKLSNVDKKGKNI